MKKKYDDAVIDYIPIKYELKTNFTENSTFLPSVFTTQPTKHKGNISLELVDQTRGTFNLEYSVNLLRKESHFSKSGCHNNALRTQ